jgi:glycerophosphoryl diester phosphodiesterase
VTRLREQVEVVMTWGVDDLAALTEVVDLGVNGVISDEVDVLRSVLVDR